MKAGSIIGLLFAAAIFATVPISPQVTSRGVAVNVDTAQAFTYGHARRVTVEWIVASSAKLAVLFVAALP